MGSINLGLKDEEDLFSFLLKGIIYSNKIHQFKMWSMIIFVNCIQFCDHYNKKDTDQFPHSKKFPVPLCTRSSPPQLLAPKTCFQSLIDIPFLEFHINGIIQHMLQLTLEQHRGQGRRPAMQSKNLHMTLDSLKLEY